MITLVLSIQLLMTLGLPRDPFQIILKNGAETYFVSYSSVKVFDKKGAVLLQGVTDKYGRIHIDGPNGTSGKSYVSRQGMGFHCDNRWKPEAHVHRDSRGSVVQKH